jgi:hypothetical protein
MISTCMNLEKPQHECPMIVAQIFLSENFSRHTWIQQRQRPIAEVWCVLATRLVPDKCMAVEACGISFCDSVVSMQLMAAKRPGFLPSKQYSCMDRAHNLRSTCTVIELEADRCPKLDPKLSLPFAGN